MSTCGLVNDRVLGFYSTDGGGVIKRLRHFVPAKVGSGEGGEASANESNFADFQSGVSLSLSLSLSRWNRRKRFRCKLTWLDRRFFRSPFPIDYHRLQRERPRCFRRSDRTPFMNSPRLRRVSMLLASRSFALQMRLGKSIRFSFFLLLSSSLSLCLSL